jgi:hypothetical protein
MTQIAGTSVDSFWDGGRSFGNYLNNQSALPSSVSLGAFTNSNTAPFSAFGSQGSAFGSVGGSPDPYAGMQGALQNIEDPNVRGMLAYNLEREKFFNDPSNFEGQLEKYRMFRKQEAEDAAKIAERLALPRMITQMGTNVANMITGTADKRAAIRLAGMSNIADIQRQALAYQPSSQRFFR